MKRIVFMALTLCLALTSCKKDADLYKGEYSYKKTGEIYADGIKVQNISETGTLRVSKIESDSVLLMFTPLNANLYTRGAKVADDKLTLPSTNLSGTIYTSTELLKKDTLYYSYTSSGNGEMHDGTILLKEYYAGTAKSKNLGKTLIITTNEILTIAAENR